MAMLHHPPAPAPQAAPSEEASFLGLVYEMGLAEGERRAYERLGIPQPPLSLPMTDSGVAAILAAILSASGPPS